VYWDALSTLSFIAAVTSRIRLATNVVVLGYHHPLEILKQYGTLDRLSAGRPVLARITLSSSLRSITTRPGTGRSGVRRPPASIERMLSSETLV